MASSILRKFSEELADSFDGRLRVLDDVVQEAGGDGDDIEPHVGELIGDLERVDEVRLSRMPHLSLVLEGGEHIRSPQQLGIGVGITGPHLLDKVFEPNHECGV
jgi:hypothetical protein